MIEGKLISVIIPVFNTEKYIVSCLKSLVNQTYVNFEVIIVDDGSTDKSYEVIQEFLNSTSLEYKILKKPNGGVSSARNLGITNSNGKYLLFLDSDDFVENVLFEKIEAVATENNVDMIFYGFDMVNEQNRVMWSYEDNFRYIQEISSGKKIMKDILDEKILIWTSSVIYKREFVIENNIKYLETAHNGEDQAFTYKALYRCSKIFNIKQVLAHYVQRPGSISHSNSLKRISVIDAFEDLCNYMQIYNKGDSLIKEIKCKKIPSELIYALSQIVCKENKQQIINVLKMQNIRSSLRLFKLNNLNKKDFKLFVRIKLALLTPTFFYYYYVLKKYMS